MLFNSYIFVLLFLPLCIVGYYLLGHIGKYKLANTYLLGMSLWFYGYFNPWYLILITASIGINYSIYLLLRNPNYIQKKKVILIIGLVLNLGILFYFKYMNFFVDTICSTFDKESTLGTVLLPLGISFFTFQQISFIADTYKVDVGEYSILEYACYVTFFPQLVAGPIVTHAELIPQLQDSSKKHLNWDNLAHGIYIFSIGMAKKVLVADTLGNAVNVGYTNLSILNSTDAIVVMLCYTLQIYFDFSGYCDMAIGIGKIFNITLPLNFNSPYKSLSINEFWDRWHMTLTRFFTRYVYIPLGGNRKGQARTYLNIFVVFLLSGIWHGAGFTFILWGILHGVFCIIHRATKGLWDRLPKFINWLATFLLVNVLWVLFRADSISDAIRLLKTIISGQFNPINLAIAEQFNSWEIDLFVGKIPVANSLYYFDMLAFLIVSMVLVVFTRNSYEMMIDLKPRFRSLAFSTFILVWSIFSFAGISTFLYFNF